MRIDRKGKLACNLVCTSIQSTSAYITSNKLAISRIGGPLFNLNDSRNAFLIHYEEIRQLKL